jgi:hypothetical protein
MSPDKLTESHVEPSLYKKVSSVYRIMAVGTYPADIPFFIPAMNFPAMDMVLDERDIFLAYIAWE